MKIDFTSVDALVALSKYEEAELVCRALIERHPTHYRVFSKLAHILALARRNAEAISATRNAIALDAEQPALWWKLGTYYLNDEALLDSISAFTEAIELSEIHSDPYYRQVAYFLRAEAHSRRCEFVAAERDLRNVEDDLFLWLDRPISKKAIIERCNQLKQRPSGSEYK